MDCKHADIKSNATFEPCSKCQNEARRAVKRARNHYLTHGPCGTVGAIAARRARLRSSSGIGAASE